MLTTRLLAILALSALTFSVSPVQANTLVPDSNVDRQAAARPKPTRTPRPTRTPTLTPTSIIPTETPSPSPTAPVGNLDHYYVDSQQGSDSNSGLDESAPLKSIAALNAKVLAPGDVVHFRRGSSWTEQLQITESGLDGYPIRFTAYGEGNPPVLEYPTERAVRILANWVVVDSFEIKNSGIGVWVEGQYNRISHNFIHDLHMVRNTVGGDDDYGATAVVLSGSNNDVSYNRMINCRAASYDYGWDGGAVEFWAIADNNAIHHNYATGNDGFLEVGGGSARNTLVYYNLSVDNGRFGVLHLSGTFGSAVENFRVENNTISEKSWAWLFYFNGTPNLNTLLFHNNIVAGSFGANQAGFYRANNLYSYVPEFPLNGGEFVANPLFMGTGDFHLQSTSPAIGMGISLGFTADFEDKPVGDPPDLGAYEN